LTSRKRMPSGQRAVLSTTTRSVISAMFHMRSRCKQSRPRFLLVHAEGRQMAARMLRLLWWWPLTLSYMLTLCWWWYPDPYRGDDSAILWAISIGFVAVAGPLCLLERWARGRPLGDDNWLAYCVMPAYSSVRAMTVSLHISTPVPRAASRWVLAPHTTQLL
jgi:hypothetical protein